MKKAIYFRDSSNPYRFYYIPIEPSPEISPSGIPTLILWIANKEARLQLGVQLTLNKIEIDNVIQVISDENPELMLSKIDLQPAQIYVNKADLLISTGNNNFESIATSKTSGFPPFKAIFSVQLSKEQENYVVSSLHGNSGNLKIIYRISAPNMGNANKNIESICDVANWFIDNKGHEHIRIIQ